MSPNKIRKLLAGGGALAQQKQLRRIPQRAKVVEKRGIQSGLIYSRMTKEKRDLEKGLSLGKGPWENNFGEYLGF